MDSRIEELSSVLSGDLKIPDTGSVVLNKSIGHPSSHQHFIKILSQLINSYLVPGLKTSSKVLTTHDVSTWLGEVQAFLAELDIPIKNLYSLNGDKKLNLLSVIVEEVQCLRLSSFAEQNPTDGESPASQEDDVRRLLRSTYLSLGFSSPPAHLAPGNFLQKLTSKFLDSSKRDPSQDPLISQKLGPAQWDILEGLKSELNEEYSTRWVMLLARLESTIQSFTWSNRLDDKKKLLVEETFGHLQRDYLSIRRPNVTLGDLLAASGDSLRFEKLSSKATSGESAFAKVRMGRVPDRGGRPRETPAPPPEVPSWQQGNRGGRGGGQQGGRGRGQGQRGGGGYHQSQGYNNRQSQGYNNNNQGQGYNHNQGYTQGGQQSQGYSNSQGYQGGQQSQGYSNSQGYQGGQQTQGYSNSQGYQGQQSQGYQGGQQSQGYGRGNHYGHQGRGRGKDHGDHHGKKRRVQDNRF